MSFEELLPVVQTQAHYAVLRYDSRRQDKIQELLAQSFEKFQRDKAAAKEITAQKYKHFVTKRSRELDFRSVVKKGYGGDSKIDALGFYQRRPDSETEVVTFNDFLLFQGKSNDVEKNYNFQLDFQKFFSKLNEIQQKVLKFRAEGFELKEIATKLKMKMSNVYSMLQEIKKKFMKFFGL